MAKWKCDACGEAESTDVCCVVEMWTKEEPECCPMNGDECEWYLVKDE